MSIITEPPRMNHATDQLELQEAETFIARILRHAHTTAEDQGNPDEARAIFRVAVEFALEMESRQSDFDRLAFIKAATGV
jgi:hypothetical protein